MHICLLASPTGDGSDPLGYNIAKYLNGYEWEQHVFESLDDIEEQIRGLMDKGVEVFINLCAGSPDDPMHDLPEVLKRVGAAFTGAHGSFFDPSRAEMKDAAARCGVPFPGSIFADTPEEVKRAAEELRFPLIVKPPHGWASVGIRRESRVATPEDLQTQAAITIAEFGSALIEEFIEGRELTALVAENLDDPSRPYAFQSMEYLFPHGESFKHVDMKWTNSHDMVPRPVRDPELDQKLREYTARLFLTMDGNGYARCDFRMNADGEILMLEINPNCGVFDDPSDPACADHILMSDPFGHSGFLKLLIDNALRSRDMRLGLVKQPVRIRQGRKAR